MNNFKDIGDYAASSAAIDATVSCAESAISNFSKVQDGEISVGEYAATVACDTAAALTLKEGGKALARQVGSTSLKCLAGSNAATATAFGLVEVGKDAFDLACGKISGAEFGKRTVGTVGGTVGGAALGTIICPGIGTAIGGVIGSMTGGLGGRSIGDAIGKFFRLCILGFFRFSSSSTPRECGLPSVFSFGVAKKEYAVGDTARNRESSR
ncbi:MAG: hypothetical protein IJU76_11660, partial [Desulfovibrionaceae bacterium]|nr:hypothetical protein [Desulfovibrionaceae bacterium]